jgi:alcohol dehydrogenase (cytochrome c)
MVVFAFSAVQMFAQTVQTQGNWTTYNRTYSGDRYSPLKQITKANVKQLHLLHTFDLGKDVSSLQTGPLVINGVMFFSTDTITYAINAATGKLVWKKVRPVKNPVGYGANRGVAYYNGKILRGASDAHVFALNALNGKILWDVKLDVAGPGVAIPMAPLAWNGLVFIGTAGGDNAGITGHMYALNTNSGKVVWKFNSVPKSGPARDTWPGVAKGIPASGGAFWTAISLDTKNGILYVPTGNPAPDFDTDLRGNGKELYTNCVIALNAKTGKILSYIQLVKNDNHDWDVSSGPALITTKNGKKIIASANKNGLLSVIDRSAVTNRPNPADQTSALRLLYEVPTTVRENVNTPLTRDNFTRFKPGILGGSEWNGAAYDPLLDLIYTGANDWASSVKLLSEETSLKMPATGENLFGGEVKFDPASEARGWVRAFNAKDGSLRWKFQTPAPVLSGVTPTAGGLIFTSAQNGDVYAFDASTGKVLWKTTTNLPNGGGVISYSVNGKQYIAVASGMKSGLWPMPSNASKIMIYGL